MVTFLWTFIQINLDLTSQTTKIKAALNRADREYIVTFAASSGSVVELSFSSH